MTPTTSRVGILQHGSEVTRRTRPDGIEETTAPAEALRALAIVDTPGTNAVLREHEALTRDFLPRADLVLFVTSADRPYTESERAFLEAIREWGKKVVLVLNKADLLETPEDLAKVVAFVRDEAAKTLGAPPEVFALCAREALRVARAGRRGRPRAKRPSRLRGEGHGDARREGALPPQAPESPWRRAPGPPGGDRSRGPAARGARGRPRRPRGDREAGGRAVGRADPRLPLPAVGRREGAPRVRAAGQRLLRRAAAPRALPRALRPRAAPARLRGGGGGRPAPRGRAAGGRDRGLDGRGGAAAVAGRHGAPRRAAGRPPGLRGACRRPLRLRPCPAPRERPRGGPRGGPPLRRAVGGAAARREGARVGGAGRAPAGLGPRPRHHRGRPRQHHRRRRHRHPRREHALAPRPLPPPRAAGEGAPRARGQGLARCARSS